MDSVPIADARRIAQDRRCLGVLVVAFGAHPETGEPTYQTTSFGHTRKTCDAMRQVNNRVFELIAQGVIEIPDALTEGM